MYDINFEEQQVKINFTKTANYIEINKFKSMHLPEYSGWMHHTETSGVTLKGKVVPGFKRGSKQLGIPTANIEMTEENKKATKNLIPGVYSAFGRFNNPSDKEFVHDTDYWCTLSIGWNPVYENPEKTIEVYIIHTFSKDFYD